MWIAHIWLGRLSLKHLANKRRQLVIFAFDHIGHAINLDGLYERGDLDILFEWLKACNVDTKSANALDVGASIGNHSLYFSDYFNHVYSFEPESRSFKVLSLNAEMVNNITCFNVGISDHSGEAAFLVRDDYLCGAYLTETPSSTTKKVTIRTLDSYSEIQNVKLMKFDVEWHELQAIRGAKEMIRSNQPIILFEQHCRDFKEGKSPAALLLNDFGYRQFAIIKKTPVAGSGMLRKLTAALRRLMFGESLEIFLQQEIKTGDYTFIVALPDWFVASLRQNGKIAG